MKGQETRTLRKTCGLRRSRLAFSLIIFTKCLNKSRIAHWSTCSHLDQNTNNSDVFPTSFSQSLVVS